MARVDQRLSLQKLEVLCLVIELGGVHRAAERLFISQPVVSAHLHSLEGRVGLPLFRKQGRRLVLTEAGEAVYAWAQSVLSQRSILERQLGALVDGGGGTASIAASMTVGTYYLPPVLFDFKRDNPAAEITLLVSDPETALRRVLTGDSDFGVIMTDAEIDPELFVASQFGRDRYVLIASPTCRLPAVVPVGLLNELSFICPPGISAVRRMQDMALREVGVVGRAVAMELGNAEVIKAAVAAGIGVALISEKAVVAEVHRGELVQIEIEGVTLSHGMTYVQRRSTVLSPLQQRLADLILDVCAARGVSTPEDSQPAIGVAGVSD